MHQICEKDLGPMLVTPGIRPLCPVSTLHEDYDKAQVADAHAKEAAETELSTVKQRYEQVHKEYEQVHKEYEQNNQG
jgi:hypothetical protein